MLFSSVVGGLGRKGSRVGLMRFTRILQTFNFAIQVPLRVSTLLQSSQQETVRIRTTLSCRSFFFADVVQKTSRQ